MKEERTPTVAVIIVCLGKPGETKACLKALVQNGTPGMNILVVENGTQEVIETLSPIFPSVTFIRLPENRGFAGGTNAGILKAKELWAPDFYFLLNNDALVEKDAVSRLVISLENRKDCAMAAPKILADRANKIFWAAGGEWIGWRFLSRNRGMGMRDTGQYDRMETLPFLTGCALLIRREAVEKVGLLEERFFIYTEDLDYCLRARRAGYNLLYVPEAVVIHEGSVTSGDEYQPFQSFYRWRNRLLAVSIHAGLFHKVFLYAVFFPLLFLRDILTYRRIGKKHSLPYLFAGVRQFFEMALLGRKVRPMQGKLCQDQLALPGERMIGGTLLRNPVLRTLLKVMDAVGSALSALKRKKELNPRPHKILVSKIDHLGDMVLFLSVLPTIRETWMGAEIHLVCGSWARPLVEGHPMLAKIFYFDHFMLGRSGGIVPRLKKMFRELPALIRALRKEQYDIAFDFRAYFPNFIPFMSLIGAGYKAGFKTGGFGFLLDGTADWKEGVHETEHFMDLIRVAEPKAQRFPSDLGYIAAKEDLGPLFSENRISEKKKLFLLHPGAGNRIKLWDAAEWKKLAHNLDDSGFQIVAVGTENERPLVQTILENTSGVNLAGKTTLRQIAALAGRAEWVIGVDSFVTHLASAVGARTAVIFNGIEDPEQWRPSGRFVRIVTKHVPCSPCYLKNGCRTMDCLKTTVEDVSKIVL